MGADEIIKTGLTIGTVIVGSLGGGAAIITAVVKWWGDILAQKMLAKVEHKYEKEIEGYKAELQDMSGKFKAMVDYSMQVATKQYDMEVTIYKDIWTALHELSLCQNCVCHFENPTQSDPNSYLTMLKNIYNDFKTKLMNFQKQIDSVAPFYQLDAYVILCDMDKEYTELLKILEVSTSLTGVSDENKVKVNTMILPKINTLKEELTRKIREYLFSLQKTPSPSVS